MLNSSQRTETSREYKPGFELNRRGMLGLLASGAGMALLAACGGTAAPSSAPPSSASSAPASAAASSAAAKPSAAAPASSAPAASAAPTSAAASAPSAVPKLGGTLRFGQVGDLLNLEPSLNQKTTSPIVWMAYDRLTQYDQNLKPQPMLAESWDVTPDFKQIKLNLRKGVTWHSGREFTSEDVKFTIQRVLDPKVGSGQFAQQAKAFNTVETPDKNTVIMKSDQSQPLLFDFLEQLCIVDKDTAATSAAPQKTVGTGPYQLTEWVQGDKVTLVKNKNYWQSGKPYLDGVIVTILKDAQAMVTQLEAGALDIIRQPAIPDVTRLKGNPQFQTLIHPSGGQAYVLGANVNAPGLSDKRVRQALNYAINRDRYVNTILGGLGTVQDLPWPQTSPAFEAGKNNVYSYNLDKAKQLMKDAGASNLSFDILPQQAEPSGGPFSQMLQADFDAIGVKLNILSLAGSAWNDAVLGRNYKGFYFTTQSYLNLLPGTPLTGAVFRPANNNQNYKDDTYEKLVTATTTEPDPAKLKATYSQLNDIILDQSFAIYPSLTAVTMVVKSTVHDLTATNSGGWWSYTNAWLG